jgi:hypothetical protein
MSQLRFSFRVMTIGKESAISASPKRQTSKWYAASAASGAINSMTTWQKNAQARGHPDRAGFFRRIILPG